MVKVRPNSKINLIEVHGELYYNQGDSLQTAD